MTVVAIALITLASGASVAGPAFAQCSASPAALVASPDAKPIIDRYNALLAGDPFLFTGKMATGWRALSLDLKRDPSVPVDLRAWTEIMLAASLQKDEEVAAGLAAAQTALGLAEAAGMQATPLHAEIMTTLAAKEANAGMTADAVAHAARAIVEMAEHHGKHGWAYGRAMISATIAYNSVGRYDETERYAAQAEALASDCLPADNPFVGQTITSHSATLGTIGRIDDSLREAERALAWSHLYGREDDTVLPDLLDSYGWTLRNAGRLHEAETVLRRSVDLYARYHHDAWADRASATGKFANVLAAEGRYLEAEALWLKTAEYYRAAHDLSNPLGGSGELRRSADAAELRGDLPLALARRHQAIDLMASHVQAQHPELARARLEYASTLSLTGRTHEAVQIAEAAIARIRVSMSDGDFKRLGAEITYARILASGPGGASNVSAAYATAAPVAARMEAILLDAATSRGDLVRFAPAFASSFATVADLALSTGRDDEAFHDLQLANLSDVAEVDAEIALRAAAADPQSRTLVERLQDRTRNRRQLDRERTFAASHKEGAQRGDVQAAIRSNDAQIVEITQNLDRSFPAFRSIGRPTPVTLAAYRARLGPGDLLIAPISLAGAAVTVAVTRDGLSWAVVSAPRSRTADLIARIRASIDASLRDPRARFDLQAARELYTIVMPAALDPLLKSHRHILYYASGALATIPPSILVASPLRPGVKTDWLIRSHRISFVPALTAAKAKTATNHDTFLGIGAPAAGAPSAAAPPAVQPEGAEDFTRRFPAALAPLPHAAHELRAMASTFGASRRRLLLGPTATATAIRSMSLTDYGVIAFATHGLLSDALPGLTEPALVLTSPDAPAGGDDGLLKASEIANLRLDADWVILSACDTASGSDAQSASFSGLTRAFMTAGARALLVSHWPVRDDAAERLTVATLRGARHGLDRPAALQQAMLGLMNDPKIQGSSSPAIWAPFVLVEQ